MPMSFRPNTTVTGEWTLAPPLGLMMYASSPGGEGVRAMETAGVCAEATGTAAIGAATEKARTIAATVGVRISVSFTRNPSQREDAIDAGDGEHQHPARQVAARSRDVGARPCRRLGRRGRERAELARIEVIDMDELHDLAVVLAQRRRLGLGHEAGGERLLDASRRGERRHLAGPDALDAEALLVPRP